MMFEAIEVINKLFTGEVVRHEGKYFTLERAKLYTRPPDDQRVPIYVATAGPVNAKKTGRFADGIITVGAADEKMERIWGKFEEGAREAGKDPRRRPGSSRSTSRGRRPTRRPCENAMVEWPNGGMAFFPKQDIKNPEDFDGIAKLVRPEDFENRVLISSDLEAHTDHIQHYVDMGFDEIHLHNVGRNQAEFIEVFGREVLPNLRLSATDAGRHDRLTASHSPTTRTASGGSIAAMRRRRVSTVSCQPGGTSRGRQVGQRREHEQPLPEVAVRDLEPLAPPWPGRRRRRSSAPPAAARLRSGARRRPAGRDRARAVPSADGVDGRHRARAS